jgi:hypothetical protein
MNKSIKTLRGISDDLGSLASSFGNTGNKYMEATLMDIADKINQEALTVEALTIDDENADVLEYATVEVTFTEDPEMPDLHDEELQFHSVNRMIWPAHYKDPLTIDGLGTDVVYLDCPTRGNWCVHDPDAEVSSTTAAGVIVITPTEDWKCLDAQRRENRIDDLLERLNRHMLGHVFNFTITDDDGEMVDSSTNHYNYGEMITEIIYTLETNNFCSVAVVGEAGGWSNLEDKIAEAGINVVQL